MHALLFAYLGMALSSPQIALGVPAPVGLVASGCGNVVGDWGPRVPGNSPANFIGDPNPDILQEIEMNMNPNPPTE